MPYRARRGLRSAALLAAVVGSFLGVAGLAGPARAQQLANAPTDLQIFRPAMDSKGFITLNSSAVLGQLETSFGLVVTYARQPLRFEGMLGTQKTAFSVDNVVTPSLQGAIGFTKLPHLGIELGVNVPISVLSGSGQPDNPSSDPNNPNALTEYTFTKQGLGDVQVLPKFRFLNATRGGLGLAVIPAVILPTGDKNAFLGEGKTIFAPQVIVDTEAGYLGRFRAGINAGMKIRGSKSEFTDNFVSYPRMFGMGQSNTNQGISIGNELIGGVGVSYGIVPQKFDALAELYGLYGLDSHKLLNGVQGDKLGPTAEAIAGIKLYLARNSFFELGGGWRVVNGYGGGAPRAFLGFIFEPSIGDRDGDGYKDDVDQCPDDPEDFDDFEDEDGCPDPDNDKDGILDVDDKCPNDPETKNGYQDEDGCPDEVPAAVKKFTGVVKGITFRRNSADIKASSFPLLKEAIKTFKDYPQLRVEISGHTSNEGRREFNVKLSKKRAEAVKAFLTSAGIDESRIFTVGYGPDKPIEDNSTKAGQEKNRRIEFRLLSPDETTPTSVPESVPGGDEPKGKKAKGKKAKGDDALGPTPEKPAKGKKGKKGKKGAEPDGDPDLSPGKKK